ncbi:MAG: hypothetical protein KF784_03695 [Fimbriimonadaceae bacterium]|nr:hypothetical protein [Fimbriimonadaceae bacterium]
MKKILALLAISALAFTAIADETPVKVENKNISISSKGSDVRGVLHDLFTQSGKNYVLEPNTHFALYLNLKDIEFEEALQIVCKLSNLDYDIQNGIFYVNKVKAKAQPKQEPTPQQPVQTAAPKGTLNVNVLNKLLTTRFQKTDLRAIIADISKQTGVTLEVSADVPAYKMDAFLINTSLKYALDTICEATKLSYKLTNNLSILIERAEPVTAQNQNRVAVIGG